MKLNFARCLCNGVVEWSLPKVSHGCLDILDDHFPYIPLIAVVSELFSENN